jgi:hypothetical protein
MLRMGIISVDESAAGTKRFPPQPDGLKMKL